MGDPTLRLLELDERHTELLDRLAELDQQVAGVLEEWTLTKELAQAPVAIVADESQQAA